MYYNFRQIEEGDLQLVVFALLQSLNAICRYYNELPPVVGIATMGKRIVESAIPSNYYWYDPHQNTGTKLPPGSASVLIVDDVLTTGTTIRKAINYYSLPVDSIFVLVNRSEESFLDTIPVNELIP